MLSMRNGAIKKKSKFFTPGIFIFCACLVVFPVSGVSKTVSIAINADSGEIIQESNADQLWFPASLTKVMTLYLTFKALKHGQLKLEDKITISKRAANQPKTRLGLKPGQRLSIKQAILAVATRSANDVAVALAEYQANTEQQFALIMTTQARMLDMNNTVFLNATGLPNSAQVTTARDMAVLAKAIKDDFPEYYQYFSVPNFTYQKQTYANYNSLLKSYSGADGIKTGFTCGSGYNLMASAIRNKKRVIAIVLGAKNKYARKKEMVSILNKAFNKIDHLKGAKNIADIRSKSLKPAFYTLKSNECHKSNKFASKQKKVSNWTIIFGAFPDRKQASKVVKKAKKHMGKFIKYGYPLTIKRKLYGQVLWHALWSGLLKDQAGKTCKRLWGAGEYCRVLHPSLFTNKNTQWN